MKRRIVLVVDDDDDSRPRTYLDPAKLDRWFPGVTVESVEDLPEPNRVQEFRVRTVSKPDQPPRTRELVRDALLFRCYPPLVDVTVTEVDPT